ncbi:hypothetical protein [Streptomyces sp. DB-54]
MVIDDAHDQTQDADALLVRDAWDDFGYRTTFTLFLRVEGEPREIGTVKIGHTSMDGGEVRILPLPERFSYLDPRYFSLGQDDSYYERLRQIPGGYRQQVLEALRDVAYDEGTFQTAMRYQVARTSLFRFIKVPTVRGQWRRIARGGARRNLFDIAYEPPSPRGIEPPRLRFRVEPGSRPPSNVHALTGRNGVGKSYLLSHLARAVAADEPQPARLGQVIEYGREGRSFGNLVAVSFSAFDEFPLVEGDDMFTASYVGLRVPGARSPKFKTPYALRRDFRESIGLCST